MIFITFLLHRITNSAICNVLKGCSGVILKSSLIKYVKHKILLNYNRFHQFGKQYFVVEKYYGI